MSSRNFFVSGRSSEFTGYTSPELLLQDQLAVMVEQVTEHGCSEPHLAPINGAVLQELKRMGEKPTLEDVITFDPVDALLTAVRGIAGVRKITHYQRTFLPGHGEGTHSDDHDLVVTYTMGGRADFTIDATPPYNSHHLGPHTIIAFNGRLNHEVSAPFVKGTRSITAFGVDL